jgi:hypothetical protein
MKETELPFDFIWRIAILYYVERFGFDALKKELNELNEDAYYEEMKDWLQWNIDNGVDTLKYIQSHISNPDIWESLFVELERFKYPNIPMSAEEAHCYDCKHLIDAKKRTCKAFPQGIPRDILMMPDGTHDKIVENQIGNFLFEPVEQWKHLYENK